MIYDLLFLLDLDEVELDGRVASENRNIDFDFALCGIDQADHTFVAREWTVQDDDYIANLHLDLEAGLGCADVFLDDAKFFRCDRDRDIAAADETGDIRRVARDVPGFIRDDHLDQDVAREKSFFLADFFTTANRDFFDFRDFDAENIILHVAAVDALLERTLHGIFVA